MKFCNKGKELEKSIRAVAEGTSIFSTGSIKKEILLSAYLFAVHNTHCEQCATTVRKEVEYYGLINKT